MQYYIGCSGWSYTSWQGPFYPKDIENSKWLRYYSKIFDYVEIDSTFYRIPNEFMVKNWYKRTPENFRFTAKLPKVITHDKRLSNIDEDSVMIISVTSGDKPQEDDGLFYAGEYLDINIIPKRDYAKRLRVRRLICRVFKLKFRTRQETQIHIRHNHRRMLFSIAVH